MLIHVFLQCLDFFVLCVCVFVFIGSFYFTYIAACVVTLGTQPLYYEIACENLFPVSEAVISGLLGFLNIVSNTLFLLVTIIPNIGKHEIFIKIWASHFRLLLSFRCNFRFSVGWVGGVSKLLDNELDFLFMYNFCSY